MKRYLLGLKIAIFIGGGAFFLHACASVQCLMYFQLFVEVLCLSLFCYALLCVHSSFAIILKRKRKLVAWLLLSYRCTVTINVLLLFLAVPWVGLRCVVVVFPYHFYISLKRVLSVAPSKKSCIIKSMSSIIEFISLNIQITK